MRKRWIPFISLLCVACGDSSHPESQGESPDGGEPDNQDVEVGSGPQSCASIVGKYGTSCEPGGYTMEECEDIRLLYVGEGCGKVWSEYASCAASATPDCEEGDFPACTKAFNALFQCQSAWASRTQCTRLRGGDSTCPATAPYALGCLGEPPSTACVMTEDDTLCCP